MPRLRRLATGALEGVLVVVFLIFGALVGEPQLWNGPLGMAWLVVLGLMCLSFAVAIAIGIRRGRSTDGQPPPR
jgi:hypothetical protein